VRSEQPLRARRVAGFESVPERLLAVQVVGGDRGRPFQPARQGFRRAPEIVPEPGGGRGAGSLGSDPDGGRIRGHEGGRRAALGEGPFREAPRGKQRARRQASSQLARKAPREAPPEGQRLHCEGAEGSGLGGARRHRFEERREHRQRPASPGPEAGPGALAGLEEAPLLEHPECLADRHAARPEQPGEVPVGRQRDRGTEAVAERQPNDLTQDIAA
jgi:hypothetical protein